MDWNWFFSSVAQSVAAIVGIFAAFIITKIINNQQQYHQYLSLMDEYMNDISKFKSLVDNINIHWYNKKIKEKELNKLRAKLKNEKTFLSSEEYLADLDLSIYETDDIDIQEIKQIMVTVSEENFRKQNNQNNPLIMEDFTSLSLQPKINDDLNEIESSINELITSINYHIGKISILLGKIKNDFTSSKLIMCSIFAALFLFFMGVICPLCFLPSSTNVQPQFSFEYFFRDLFSFKGFILLIVSIIFSSIMLSFYVINRNLKYPPDKINALNKYLLLSNYSKYFKKL